MELKERASGGAASQLFPPVKSAVQQDMLVIVFVTKAIHNGGNNLNFSRQTLAFIDQKKHMISHERQESGGRDSADGQVRGFCRPKQHVISQDRQENIGRDSGEGHVSGLINRRKVRGGPPPHGYQILSTRTIPGPRTVIGGQDDRYRQTP